MQTFLISFVVILYVLCLIKLYYVNVLSRGITERFANSQWSLLQEKPIGDKFRSLEFRNLLNESEI